MTDKLEELFRLQKQLNERIGVHTDRMTENERQQWLLNYCRAMSQEVATTGIQPTAELQWV